MAEDGTGQQEPQEPQTDWKAEARKWEKRAKENREKAEAYDGLRERSEADLEKAREAAKSYKEQLDALSAKAEMDALKAKVSKATGVPAELIAGDDEDSMRGFAEAVARFAKPPAAPKASGAGRFAADAGDDGKAAYRELASRVFGAAEE